MRSTMGARALLVAAAAAIALASCASTPGAAKDESASSASLPRGGTLRIATVSDPFTPGLLSVKALDPKVLSTTTDELFRCCLLRTLYSFRGVPTDEGGLGVEPDLASGPAEVSSDGLSWTVHLRKGVHYGPPFRDREVTSEDVVRGIERALQPGSPSPDASEFEVITGVKEFESGATTTISGLETPDDLTLVVRLVNPLGDLDSTVLALPDGAPLAPGAADGHDDLSHFLVSTGPYMLEGSEQLDFSLPPAQQKPLASFVEGQSITLVRNPAWDPATDPLRPALVDRIEFKAAGTVEQAAAAVDRGDADLLLPPEFTPTLPGDVLARYQATPALSGRLFVNEGDAPRALNMNLAVPPFDDIHVRKAVNLVLDKQGIADTAGGVPTVAMARHLVPNALEHGLLDDYDPYASAGSRGDVAAAMAEMRQSRYDHDGDGVCDDPVCSGIEAGARDTPDHPMLADVIASNLAKVGLLLHVDRVDDDHLTDKYGDPRSHEALFLDIDWTGFTDASDFLAFVFSHPADENSDFSLVGASPDQLSEWGYSVTSVPNVDDAAQSCEAQTGNARVTCAAALDQQLMQTVVPWAPLQFTAYVTIVSARVAHYSLAQADVVPAFDQIALVSGSG